MRSFPGPEAAGDHLMSGLGKSCIGKWIFLHPPNANTSNGIVSFGFLVLPYHRLVGFLSFTPPIVIPLHSEDGVR